MADFEKIMVAGLAFAFLVFLFPTMYEAVLASGTTSALKPLLLVIPIVFIGVTGVLLGYFLLGGRR